MDTKEGIVKDKTEYQYVVVSRYSGTGDTKVAGPYSKRQAAQVARDTLGKADVVRLVRPVYWLSEDDDLRRFQPPETALPR